MDNRELVKKLGKPFSKVLGINLSFGDNEEIVKWFLASLLYGKPIRESSATKTYRCFKKHNLLSTDTILKAGWNKLVSILDEGGYTRYDFSTADKLLEVFGNLKSLYNGDLTRLHADSKDPRDLEARLKSLSKGIGGATISIFLRDMRKIWRKADPKPTPIVKEAIKFFSIRGLKSYAKENHVDIIHLEAALFRQGKSLKKQKPQI